MPEILVNLNGRLTPANEASISVFDYGLLYGLALFETLRVSEGQPVLLSGHLARLERSAQALGIPLPGHRDSLAEAVRETVRANGFAEARVRITLTAGEGRGGPDGPPEKGPTCLITAFPLQAIPASVYETGHKAIIATVRRSSQSPMSQHKTTNRLEQVLASREAALKGAQQAIMLNEKRCVTECATANIFFVAYGGLATPALECGLLPGITRDVVIGLAPLLDISADERWISSEEVWDAEEAFVTSAVLGIMPVTSVNGHPIGDGAPGRVSRALMEAYAEFVRKELEHRQP